MGWSLGYDEKWKRWIGYGVPAYCDHPDCNKEIDRGLAFVCGGEPYGGENGCGLFFCSEHLSVNSLCQRCETGKKPFKPKKEHPKWIKHIITDKSWRVWREENKKEFEKLLKKWEKENA